MIERFELDTEQWAVVPRVPTEEMLRGLVGPNGYTSIRLVEAFLAMLAAAPRPEAGQQDGAVIDYGSIDQSSEFIQLFNAAFEALKHGHSIGICWDLMKAAKAELNKLAKQQPAPRPVPTPPQDECCCGETDQSWRLCKLHGVWPSEPDGGAV